MSIETTEQIRQALEKDTNFKFKRRGKFLQGGVCPDCSKKELFISLDQPYVLKCNRLNNCGYEESTRQVYPQFFTNYSERYPANDDDPNRTAKAYMKENRGFPAKINKWFVQESYRLPGSNIWADTVRFYFDKEKTRYWERLIDREKINKDGKKQRFNIGGQRKRLAPQHADYNDYDGSLYKGEWWQPPGQKISSGDVVYWVEGPLHAIALAVAGFKVISGIAATNYPALELKKYKGQNITFILALDDDKAGRTNMEKHAKKLKKDGFTFDFALTGDTGKDWDDLHRLGKINQIFLEDCIHRGRLHFAETIKEKAYWWYLKSRQSSGVLTHKNRFFSVNVDENLSKELAESLEDLNQVDIEGLGEKETVTEISQALQTEKGRSLFFAACTSNAISNCLPEFLYCEIDKFNGELAYYFHVVFPNKNPTIQIALTGSSLDGAKSFNKALLNQSPGSTFDGSDNQLKRIRERWFDRGVRRVETIPFIGYDKSAKAYIFPSFGYQKGRSLKVNSHGFIDTGKYRLKTSFKSIGIEHVTEFKNDWLPSFHKVFSDNGMLALAFWFGSIFAEQIRGELKAFPFFELTGDHGAGKSTLLEFLWKLVGRDDYEGFDPGKATFAGRARAFSQAGNLPVVLIESDRDGDKSKKGSFDFDELKTAFNGGEIRVTGAFNRGNDVQAHHFRGTIVIAQNATVDGSPALLSRIVHSHCTKSHFSSETKGLAPQFERAKVEDVAGFLTAALSKETDILKIFLDVFSKMDTDFTARGGISDSRVIKTHSMLAALFPAMALLFPEYLTAERVSELQNFVYLRGTDRQQRLASDHFSVQMFWDQYDFLNVQSEGCESGHPAHGYPSLERQTLNHSNSETEIAISLPHMNQVCEQHRQDRLDWVGLKKLLPNSQRYKFKGTKNVKSQILGKAVHCWVFSVGQGV